MLLRRLGHQASVVIETALRSSSMGMTARLTDAFVLAVDLHGDQRRKASGAPYVAHLLGVAALVLEYGGEEDEVIAALLHDAVEDQGGVRTAEVIRSRFGDAVATTVLELSDTVHSPKPPWRERKTAAIDRLRRASPSVLLVSIADKIHNIRSLLSDHRRTGESVWELFKGGRDGTLWYFREVLRACRGAGAKGRTLDLLREYERLVGELSDAVSAAESGGRTGRGGDGECDRGRRRRT